MNEQDTSDESLQSEAFGKKNSHKYLEVLLVLAVIYQMNILSSWLPQGIL